MKKTLYLCLCALFIVTLSASKASSQTITGHYNYHYCDSEFFYVTSFPGGTGMTLVTFFGDGSNMSMPIDTTVNFSHSYGSPGIYTVKEVLYSSGSPVDSATFSDSIGFCRTITLLPYWDNNSNCAFDAGDNYMLVPITVEIDSAGVPVDTITATAIHYLTPASVPTATLYAFKLLSAPTGGSVTCPGSGIVYDTIGTSFGNRFMGFTCSGTSGFDLSEIVHIGGPGRHMYDAHVAVYNTTCTGTAATLTMTFSPKYNYTYASPSPTSVVGNVITWDLPSVSLVVPAFINAHFDVPSTWLLPGDTIHTSYVVTPITGDTNPANNTIIRVDTVVSSYDPNFKSVIPSGIITAGTNLNYQIAFENTGNAPAVNIHIQDTLSDDLDINSFKLQAASAPVYTTMSKWAGHNVIKFDFPNINLPDSTHHGQCEGMVTFTINSKTGLPNGTVINNEAGIYFDGNEVVMTNMAKDVIGIPTAVSTMSNTAKVEIYPNPSTDQFTINISGGSYSSVEIVNTLGQVVMKKAIGANLVQVPVTGLPSGIYYVTLKGDNGTKVVKFEKM